MIPAKVKNWPKFQHYRHRAPTWIKLHRALLDDIAFVRLPTVAKAVLPLVWLLAAEGEGDGSFDADPEYLAFRFRMPVQEVAAATVPLVNQGFISVSPRDASALLELCSRIVSEAVEAAIAVAHQVRASLPIAVEKGPLDNQRLTHGAEQNASTPLAIGYQVARPEKSREETENKAKQSRSVENTVGAAPDFGSSPAADSSAVVAHVLPAKGGEPVELTRGDVLELAELYPLVDVDSELRNIRGWLTTHEERRKVGRKGTRKMIATWLGKEQRRLADVKRNGQTPKAPSAVGRNFDADEHRGAGSASWLDDPAPSTPQEE